MLTSAFFLALTALFFQGVFVPIMAILAFSPFLALTIMSSPFQKALLLSVFSGVMMDLFSSGPIGIHALNYLGVCLFLYRFKKHFLYEHPLHVSLFTLLVSLCSTLLALPLLFLFDKGIPFNGRCVGTDLIGMPVVDALYAFAWFLSPITVFRYFTKAWRMFWLKRKNRSPISP
ncbi:MAG: hypothetical protein A3D96_03745 [Chlamydiae bacterium RIFCSPHIGHO2_12_FULL_44_59]|nr:MAG: hypothetical protein A2796_02430 [Chlamydiae bacterium RIFCSPHIGHO2_01_FULL_44_39]OGN59875.1 MAG: hypothetical protein A3D96_03745 [Chlamydiae bacterium RIFCSPHIGHO2_12_FULL_44_59]OGN66082.1 MAG: hypothetical protein A2978_04260 [Chlamydiae bacterium RIFCSPLOWO2_01_FULL_44_52]OGN68618.1 MAG: hypothetical protein A3I67_02585 [Chlamydiae bacterium RIFCSPLOWO2_02_FULL_45_22]OGN69730.1 MAG: hypothetical protein A3F79_01460 [Chlamydiae bacterium RIFCSPLOWO2_12_FULL_45_20]